MLIGVLKLCLENTPSVEINLKRKKNLKCKKFSTWGANPYKIDKALDIDFKKKKNFMFIYFIYLFVFHINLLNSSSRYILVSFGITSCF